MKFRPLTGTTNSVGRSFGDRQMMAVYDALLQRHISQGLLVAKDRTVLHVFGDAGRYLSLPSGRMESDVLSLVDGELRLAIATGLQRAVKSAGPILSRGIGAGLLDEEDQLVDVSIQFYPPAKARAGFFQISFTNPRIMEVLEEEKLIHSEVKDFCGNLLQQRVGDLESELKSARDNLKAVIEELQTTNEELQSTNEELLASNEELQSTNEELHSVNEELFTVNAEYERKNRELHELNLDHDNLLQSLDVGTLFLNSSLRIRKYNTALSKVFHLLPQDIGRPIEDIAYQLDGQEVMLEDLRIVLAGGSAIEKEIQTRDGTWLLKKVLPFISSFNEISGVIMTYTNIDHIKQAQKMTLVSEERFSAAIHASLDPFFLLKTRRDENRKTIDFDFIDLNQPAQYLFALPKKNIMGLKFSEIVSGSDAEEFQNTYCEVVETGQSAIENSQLAFRVFVQNGFVYK